MTEQPPNDRNQGKYTEHVNKTIAALQQPASFLLFILMVVLTIEITNVYEYIYRHEALRQYMSEVESNRSAEMREASETIRELSRRPERAKATPLEYYGPVGIEE